MDECSRQQQATPGSSAAGKPVSDLPFSALPAPADLLQLDALIARISARIIKAAAETLDDDILSALQQFFRLCAIDRGGLIAVWEGAPVVTVSHAWYGEGVPQVPADLNLAEFYPWTYSRLVGKGEIVAIDRLEDFPPEADVDRRSHFHKGTMSTLTIPLFLGPSVHHIIAAGVVREHRTWDTDFIERLRLLGEIFVSALQRRSADLSLRQAKERLDLAAASADAGFWELDFASERLWANNNALKLFGFDPSQALTLERFFQEVVDEDREMIRSAIETARRTGAELDVEYRVPGVAGGFRWMHSRGRVIEATGGVNARRLTGVTLELTGQKMLQQRLQEHLREIERLREQLEKENAYLRNEVIRCEQQREIFGAGQSMRTIMAQVEQVARTGSTVLIQGETGTGKELVAEAIHRLSERGKRVLVKVNCAALPAALVESELFGREKGAFTGALSRQTGRFELADGSTLFLDEIAEMPLEIQSKLLRVLQQGEFERLGSPRTVKVDVRVIAATNRDLAEEVEQGRFRRDLYYRLNVFPIHVPPLRKRPDEIPQLVWEFVNEFGERMGKKIRRIAASDMQALMSYGWPGNVRELRNVIEHAMIVSTGDLLALERPAPIGQQGAASETLEDVERRHIQAVLKTTHGRIKGVGGAAERLGINPSTLYSRMRKLGIDPLHS